MTEYKEPADVTEMKAAFEKANEFYEWPSDDFRSGHLNSFSEGWFAAKRAAVGSAEPVAASDWQTLSKTPTTELLNELCKYAANGHVLKGYQAMCKAAPPAPVSAEPVTIHDALRWSKANRDYHGYIAFTPDQLKLFVSHIQSAPAAPLSDAKDREFISEEDFSTLFHFNEQAQDSEADGYTASKEEMKRLAELGVVQSLGFGRYGVTSFGSWLIEKRFEQDTRLPLRTGAEHEKREHDAWKAYCEQMKSGDTAWVNLPNDVRHQWHERAAIAAAKGDME